MQQVNIAAPYNNPIPQQEPLLLKIVNMILAVTTIGMFIANMVTSHQLMGILYIVYAV